MINIAFFGTPELTVVILDSLKRANLRPSLIVTNPDKPKGRGLDLSASPAKLWAIENNIPCLQPEKLDDDFMKSIADKVFDLFVVVAYGKILPERLINFPKHGTINIHYSLLPKYRGATPVESAILNGDITTGVCIQKMAFKLDAGPIIACEEIALAPHINITTSDLRDALNRKAAALLPDTIRKYISGEIVLIPQDEKLASMSRKIKKEDGLIDLDGDPILNDRKFRAYSTWPRTYFFAAAKNNVSEKVRIIITDARYENGKFEIKKVIPAGGKEMSFNAFNQTYT